MCHNLEIYFFSFMRQMGMEVKQCMGEIYFQKLTSNLSPLKTESYLCEVWFCLK